jgi:hypothetical protein
VLKGVSNGDDIENDEANRRATFARTAASTLRLFVRGGGDMRALTDLSKVTKGALRRAVAPKDQGQLEGLSRSERTAVKSLATYERAVQRLAESNPEAARERLELALEELGRLLDNITPAGNRAAEVIEPGATTTIAPGRARAPDRPTVYHRGA